MASELPTQLASLSAVVADFMSKYQTIVGARVGFERLADLIADDVLTESIAVGTMVTVLEFGGFNVVKVESGTVHYTAAGGAKFRIRSDRASPMMFGAIGDGVADDTAALDLLEASDAVEIDLAGRTYRYSGVYATAKPITGGSVIDSDRTQDYTGIAKIEALGAPILWYAGNANELQRSLTTLTQAAENTFPGAVAADAILTTTFNVNDTRQLGLGIDGRVWARAKVAGVWSVWRALTNEPPARSQFTYELVAGSDGDLWPAGSFQALPLNLTSYNDLGIVRVGNQLIFPETRTIRIDAAFSLRNDVGAQSLTKVRLRKVTDNTTAVVGTGARSNNDTCFSLFLKGQFAVTAGDTFEVQGYASTSNVRAWGASGGEKEVFYHVDFSEA